MPNQYFATNRMVGDGSTTSWPFSFSGARPDNGDGAAPYLTQDDVRVALVVYDAEGRESWEPISFELVGPSTVEVIPAIALDQEFVVYRSTEIDVPVADFTDFSSISERDLDDSFRQTLFVTQEALDRVQDATNAANSVQGVAGEALNTSRDALDVAEGTIATAQAAEQAASQAVNTASDAETSAAQAVSASEAATDTANSALTVANNALDTTQTFSDRVDNLQDSVDELLEGGTVEGLMFKDENLAGLVDYAQARLNLSVPSVIESEAYADNAARSAASSAVLGHERAATAHTPQQVGADPAGTAAQAVAGHAAAANPHPQYARLAAPNNFARMPTVNGDPIVGSGSNSDGGWVRWADGTQQAWRRYPYRAQGDATAIMAANFLTGRWEGFAVCASRASAVAFGSFVVEGGRNGAATATMVVKVLVHSADGIAFVESPMSLSLFASGRWK